MVTTAVEEAWIELEQSPASSGVVLRRAPTPPPTDVFFGMRLPERHPALILRVDGTSLGNIDMVETAAMTVSADSGEAAGSRDVAVIVELSDDTFRDVFATLVMDLLARVNSEMSDDELASVVGTRLGRWQELLRRRRRGLTLEQQRGLYGELELLALIVDEGVPVPLAVDSWTGPMGAEHDFRTATVCLECKAKSSTRGGVRIASEFQLAPRNSGDDVILAVFDVDEVVDGNTLNQQVDRLRDAVAREGPQAAERFEAGVLNYGWLESHRDRYEHRLWDVLGHRVYHVEGEFPRLAEHNLPAGVSAVHYQLNLSQAAPWKREWALHDIYASGVPA